MTSAIGMESPLLSIATRQNRSLSKHGRRLWLLLIATSVAVIAGGAAMVGAWLILPFAGLEVFLVWLAFYFVGQHEMDYESLVVTKNEFRWECRAGRKLNKLEGSRHWATVSRTWETFEAETIHLLYAGNKVSVGRLMSAAERRVLGEQMAMVFKCAV
jgi:uncharacterized membrane protein